MPARSKRPRRVAAIAATAAVGVAIGSTIAFLPLSAYSFSPGDAIPVQSQIRVAGEPVVKGQGSILMTDVLLTQLTPITWFVDQFNSSVNIYPASEIFGGSNPSQLNKLQIGQMVDSKTAAVMAAYSLVHLPLQQIDGGQIVATISGASRKLEIGDVITAVNGKPVTTALQVAHAVQSARSSVTLAIARPQSAVGQPRRLVVTVKKFVHSGKKVIGVSLVNGLVLKLQRPVTISTGQIGGPSAGLAFTLGVLQGLGVLHLSAGATVAATGTMDPQGQVGDVGGVRQKAIAVAREGAKVFLVPPQEVAAARGADQKGLVIVPVTTLRSAIGYLVSHHLATYDPGAA
ncbi:MAG: PDZ domain-containing protein [Actinomycetota bacterium]|nr:PDZ domain-containing protein [Actinomycetota bacterium]